MLGKRFLLRKKRGFDEVREKGVVWQTPLFGISCLKSQITNNKLQTDTKIGFVVSKKISKRAVDRNRIKRLLAETVVKNKERMPKNIHLVFLAKTTILGKGFDEVSKCWMDFLDKYEKNRT